MADAVIVVNAEGKAVFTNEAYDATFGGDLLEVEDEAGRPMGPEYRPTHRAASGEAFTMHFSAVDRAGMRRWFEANGRPVPGSGESAGVVVIRDVTERSLQSIQDAFVAMLSHELRTPLTGMSGYLQMLVRRLRATGLEEEERYAERALSQVRRFTRLVDDLFDANRLRSGRMTLDRVPTELGPLLEEAIALSQPMTDQRIELRMGRTPLWVEADGERLLQVILNLIANAVRHAPESPRVELGARKRGRRVEIMVRDWGPGIPHERLAVLLRESAPGPAVAVTEGLGLGLIITRSIVEAHSGSIDVHSAPQAGTTFRISLPLIKPPASGRGVRTSAACGSRESGSTLGRSVRRGGGRRRTAG
jgi:PAS domain S-box-containing protein